MNNLRNAITDFVDDILDFARRERAICIGIIALVTLCALLF